MPTKEEAAAVFAAMMGMPKLPEVYAIFKENTGWSSGGAFPSFDVKSIRLWTQRSQVNSHLTMVAKVRGNKYDLDGNTLEKRSQRAEFIPDDWWVINLMTRHYQTAKEFYLINPRKEKYTA